MGSATLLSLLACSSSSSDGAAAPATTADDAGSAEASGPAVGVPGGSVSGSRLIIRTFDATDGTVVLAEIYDKTLGVRCVPRKMTGSDKLRCIPDVAVGFYGGVFADPSCTTLAPLSLGIQCPTAKFALTNPDAPCAEIDVYPVTGNATTVYEKIGATCRLREQNGTATFRTVSTKMAAADFVAFTPTREVLTPELSIDVLVGEDGSRIVASSSAHRVSLAVARLFDSKSHGPCVPRFGADGAPRCLPLAGWEPTSFANAFSDSACGSLSGFAAACSQPGVPLDDTLYMNGKTPAGVLACEPDQQYTVHKAIPSVDAVTYQKDDQGACKENPPGNPVATAGVEVPASSFPKLDFGKVAGGTRLSVNGFSVGGKMVEQGRIHDNELGMDCNFLLAADGSVRCLPVPAFTQLVYTDSSCTQEALVAVPTVESCSPPTYARIDGFEADCGDEKLHVYKVGPKLATPSKVYTKDVDCKELTLPPEVKFIYPFLDEAPASAFVEAKVVDR